jgi:hypothetical protein
MTKSTDFHRHFFITCLGAYDDSGLGTGGFVAVHDGRATIIDKIDSTGLCLSGNTVYRFARGLQAMIGYRIHGLHSLLKIPEARDIHDIAVRDGQFVCASTGTNEVLWFDALGGLVRRWRAEGTRDAWHLNCFCEFQGRLHVSAFGRFSEHRGWVGQSTGTGFIFDLESGREVVTGLSGPHNPRWTGDQWLVCNSHTNSLFIDSGRGVHRHVQLGGFARGLAFDQHFYYVGESANRKADVPSDHSFVAVINRATLQIVERFPIPFPEIYEVLPISAQFAASAAAEPDRFRLDLGNERTRGLETQVELGLNKIESLNLRLWHLRRYEAFHRRLVNVKRSVVG